VKIKKMPLVDVSTAVLLMPAFRASLAGSDCLVVRSDIESACVVAAKKLDDWTARPASSIERHVFTAQRLALSYCSPVERQVLGIGDRITSGFSEHLLLHAVC